MLKEHSRQTNIITKPRLIKNSVEAPSTAPVPMPNHKIQVQECGSGTNKDADPRTYLKIKR